MSRRAPRQRLTVDARREQLLGLGMELFSTRAYDEVWIEEIAGARIERALAQCKTTPALPLLDAFARAWNP